MVIQHQGIFKALSFSTLELFNILTSMYKRFRVPTSALETHLIISKAPTAICTHPPGPEVTTAWSAGWCCPGIGLHFPTLAFEPISYVTKTLPYCGLTESDKAF